MQTFIFTLILFVSYSAWSQTICTTKDLPSFDPHQSNGALESYLADQVYVPFFSATGKPGVITGISKKKTGVWEMDVAENIEFQSFNGWKPKRKLNASDVVWSIQRQLSSFARSVSELESYIPAKINGLEKSLISVREISPQKVELTFRTDPSKADLEKIFTFPSGVVLSKEYADSGKSTEFFPANGKFEWKKISPGKFDLQSRYGKQSQTILAVRSYGLTLKKISENNCKRLYYAPDELVKNAREKKVNATVIPVSSSRVYFRFNHTFVHASEFEPLVSWSVRPDAFPALANAKRSTKFFSPGTKITKPSLKKKLPQRTAYLYYCPMAQIREEEFERFIDELRTSVRQTLNLELSLAPLSCDQLLGLRPAHDTFGVLSLFEYRTPAEFMGSFDCRATAREIFGFCQSDNLRPEVIDRKVTELKRIYPIAQLDSFMLEFF